MARLKIISRSLALGMRLTDTHEVEEESADGLNPEHPPTLDGFDVLVLDVGDPVLAVNTVNSLREDDQAIPVMLVSGYQPEWEQVEAQEVEGVHVVPLPITRQALLRGVAILLDEDPELIIVDPTGTLPLVGAGTRTNGTLTKDSDAGDGSAEDSTDESAAHGTRQPSGSDPAADDHASDDHAADDHASANHQGSARTQSPPDASSSSSQDPTADADRSSQADTDPAKPSDPAEPSATADAGGPHQDDDTTLAAKPTDPDGQVGSTQPIAREAGSPHPRTSSAPGTASKRAAGSKSSAGSKDSAGSKSSTGSEEPSGSRGSAGSAKEPAKAGPADVAAAKAVRRAAEAQGSRRPDDRRPNNRQADNHTPDTPKPDGQAQDSQAQDSQRPSTQMHSTPARPAPSTGRLGQQIAARRALGQAGELAPQQDRYRRGGSRPAAAGIEVTPSQVAGLSYSTPVARPFSEHPPPGQFPLDRVGQGEAGAPPAPGARPSRWRNTPPPETGSIPMDSSNIAANRRMQRLGDRPRKLQRRTPTTKENAPRTPGRGLVTDPLGPRTNPYGFPVSALERRLDAEAGGPEGNAAEPVARTGDVVRLLQARAHELYGVSDTSQVLADDVVERAGADAAAVLVPDGSLWRVSGGVGLRPAERRLELAETHWLINEIGRGGRAVLIDDTDIVRQQLSGAPLAAWRRLLAIPVPDVQVVVVLARGDSGEPFTDRDLSAVYPPISDCAVLLAQAIETRRLARSLAPFQETEPGR